MLFTVGYLRSYRSRRIRRFSCPSETRNKRLNGGSGQRARAGEAAARREGRGRPVALSHGRARNGRERRAEGSCGKERERRRSVQSWQLYRWRLELGGRRPFLARLRCHARCRLLGCGGRLREAKRRRTGQKQ